MPVAFGDLFAASKARPGTRPAARWRADNIPSRSADGNAHPHDVRARLHHRVKTATDRRAEACADRPAPIRAVMLICW